MSMSIRQFAKELGVSHEAIRKAIRKEAIPREAIGSVTVGSRTMPTIENVELAANCYRASQNNKGHQAGLKHAAPETAKARFIRESFRAKREQMRYEKEAGLLVPRSKIVVAIHIAEQALKKLIPPKYHAALNKILATLRKAVDRQGEDGSA